MKLFYGSLNIFASFKIPFKIIQNINKTCDNYHGTVASVVIKAIVSGTNEDTLMKATHPMIMLGQFGACTKLV